MPRVTLDLQDPETLRVLSAQWRVAPGLVPGQPNEGLVSQLEGSPARLVDYDDSGWDTTTDLAESRSQGLTFAWYRNKLILPERVGDLEVRGKRCVFETCIDDYGEIWINGECARERGAIQGFNAPQRVAITADAQPGDQITIALLAINGPIGAPGGGVHVRYAHLGFEWPDPRWQHS